MAKKIGGFYGLELPKINIRFSFNELWHLGASDLTLYNARSCLFYLIKSLQPRSLWLPAYICTSVPEAFTQSKIQLNYYPITEKLSPNVSFLKQHCRDNDAILAVNYFGKPPELDFIDFVHQHPQMHWIEDSAQAMNTNIEPWGHWRLYSPRKLLGIPDGGILVKQNSLHSLISPQLTPIQETEFINPALLRYEDQDECITQVWHQQNKVKENKMTVSTRPMSRFSDYLLHHTNPSPLLKKRQQNYRFLANYFPTIRLFAADHINFVPLGFPIRITNRDAVWESLISQHIFAQCHWQHLPENSSLFMFERKLSGDILTIPCDHRYSLADMKRIAHCLEKII